MEDDASLALTIRKAYTRFLCYSSASLEVERCGDCVSASGGTLHALDYFIERSTCSLDLPRRRTTTRLAVVAYP